MGNATPFWTYGYGNYGNTNKYEYKYYGEGGGYGGGKYYEGNVIITSI